MRNILTIILLFIGFAVSAQITVNTPFKVNSNNPIDTRLNISKLSDTTTIVFKYPGLITYVQDRDQFYYYDGTTWKLFEQGGSSFIFTIDSSAQAVGLATYSLSNNNNLGFPSGTLISTGSTLYANDSLAALQLDTNEVYFLSPSNDYGTPSGVGRALYPTKTYSSDNEAILNGVDFGDIYALSAGNIYAAPANTVKEVRYLREREAVSLGVKGWLKDSLNSADVVIDANGNDLELNNLDSLVVQGNAVFKNTGQFPLLNINATNRLVEVPSQSTFRLSSNAVLTPIGASTTFIAGDSENDLKPITPDAAQNLIGINGGVYSSTVDASGNATVAHGLSSAPVSATITGITDDERTYKVINIDGSNITVVVYEGNTKLTSTAVQFYWMVIK